MSSLSATKLIKGKNTSFLDAINSGSLERVKYLVSKGADVNARDDAERTVLQESVKSAP